MENDDALRSAKVRRRCLLQLIDDEFSKDEKLKPHKKVIPWSEIGSIERQCDLLERLIKEYKQQKL